MALHGIGKRKEQHDGICLGKGAAKQAGYDCRCIEGLHRKVSSQQVGEARTHKSKRAKSSHYGTYGFGEQESAQHAPCQEMPNLKLKPLILLDNRHVGIILGRLCNRKVKEV